VSTVWSPWKINQAGKSKASSSPDGNSSAKFSHLAVIAKRILSKLECLANDGRERQAQLLCGNLALLN
jgi:hypothetical protein